MSPPYIESPYEMCYPCLGTCVTHVSGPYKASKEGILPAFKISSLHSELSGECGGIKDEPVLFDLAALKPVDTEKGQ